MYFVGSMPRACETGMIHLIRVCSARADTGPCAADKKCWNCGRNGVAQWAQPKGLKDKAELLPRGHEILMRPHKEHDTLNMYGS